nr:MAG TPA: hypothetical protein [Caudoviricetes sp.]
MFFRPSTNFFCSRLLLSTIPCYTGFNSFCL